ncbi:hypothetical protein IVA88_28910 [Bradyrhizobium sp. 149]|nr:hypothetical protein [Bradyrhizobium sp. 149]MCK1655421.1 hypothetical protein [Bradyrhizobium sp. 149]
MRPIPIICTAALLLEDIMPERERVSQRADTHHPFRSKVNIAISCTTK